MAESLLLHDEHVQAGATFVEQAGWLLPAHFGDPANEYRQALESVALFDRSHHGKIELVGTDAAFFLQNLCSNEVMKLAAGSGCEAFLATAKAKVIGLVHLYRRDANLIWLDSGPGQAEKITKHLDHFIISEQVELADRTREFAQFHLAGPRAAAILNGISGTDVSAWKDLQHLTTADGVQLRRHDGLSVPGYDLVMPRQAAQSLWQALLAAGAKPAGNDVYHVLRVEAGTPLVGADIDENNLVMEVDRTARAVSYTKGCFLGQEPIVRARDLGHVNWKLRGLKLPSGPLPERDTKLLAKAGAPGAPELGRITSVAVSPRLGNIALAYIRRGHDSPGTGLALATGDEAVVSSLPFPF